MQKETKNKQERTNKKQRRKKNLFVVFVLSKGKEEANKNQRKTK
jgi:hypothetical protein